MSTAELEQNLPKVTFIVGPEGSTEKFVMRKNDLCEESPFLKAAFNGNAIFNNIFIEGETQSMRLDDVDPAVFKLLASYMDTDEVSLNQEPKPTAMPLAKLWVLFDRFLMPAAQNAAMKPLCNRLSWATPEDTLTFCNFVYDTFAMNGDVLKRAAIDHVAFGGLKRVEAVLDKLPTAMILEVTKVLFVRAEKLNGLVDWQYQEDTELNYNRYQVKTNSD